jgi:hypothetical protein
LKTTSDTRELKDTLRRSAVADASRLVDIFKLDYAQGQTPPPQLLTGCVRLPALLTP